jgi:manganese/zinc/iron transport system permease protein
MIIATIVIMGCLVSISAALPGCFLLLRRMAMMSDAISHSILLGIVLMFFAVKTIHSPLLILAATLTGLVTVTFTEYLVASNHLKKDAAIGLIFPLFFAIAIILINIYASSIHLDQDSVILGEIALTPFERLIIYNHDMGPLGLWTMGTITLINCIFIGLFYKELKISTFDPQLSTSMGFNAKWLHYALMSCVSITCVGAFNSVGTILIVALMITPPATAYLLTHRLAHMIIYSVLIGCLSALIGTLLAISTDTSISGSICTIAGLFFFGAFLISPRNGVIQRMYMHNQNTIEFCAILLTIQLLHHQNDPHDMFETTMRNVTEHMQWSEVFTKKVIAYALDRDYIFATLDHYGLTPFGVEIAKRAIKSS